MSRDPALYISDIIEACERIMEYMSGVNSLEDFKRDRRTYDAVLRNIQIIGEATKRLSADLRRDFAAIPWPEIAGMRDKIVHDYFGIDPEAVWDTARHDVPELHRILTETR